MANHKSARKRSIQSKVKNTVNSQYLSKIRTNLNKFTKSLKADNSEEATKSLQVINSIMAKSVKKWILKNNICPESYPRYQIKSKKINFFFNFFTFILDKNT